MQYITIPTIDGKELKLSKYILGSDFPLSTPADVTSAIVDRYRALGDNTIDTARFYGGIMNQLSFGFCERRMGDYLREHGCRDEMVLITKGGFPWLNPDFTFRRLRVTREAILGDFYTSIDNLNGPVDLYLLHRDDESKPVSYIMDTSTRS